MLTSRLFYAYFLLSALSFAALGVFIDPPSLMAPDSSTYLNGDIRRTIGYPIFLSIVGFFNNSYSLLPYIQGLIYAFSVSFLVCSYSRVIDNRFFCCLFVAVISLNPIVWIYNSQMLAESLFMSLTMVCLGLIINAIYNKDNKNDLVMIGVTIALLILVKPVGYAYFSIVLFILFFLDSKKISSFFQILIPLLLILLLASFKNYYSHGVFATQVFGGYNLLGQVVPIIVEVDGEDNQSKIQTKISQSTASLTNELPSDLYSWRKHFFLTAFSYNKGLGEHATPIIFNVYGMENASLIEKLKLLNSIGWDISITAILNNPSGYSKLVFANFLGLWYLPTVTSRVELTELKEYLCSDIFVGFFEKEDCNGVLQGVQISETFVFIKNFVFTILLLTSLALIAFSLLKFLSIKKVYALGLFPALMINSHHLLVSLLEAGLSRYALSTWPLLVALVFFILIFLLKKTFK